MSTFGATLRTDRERLKMSQDQLAEMLGVSQQAVANWEAGVSMPRRERRARLLQILGPSSELSRNPPRYEFIPSEDRAVSHGRAIVSGAHNEPENMAVNPDNFDRKKNENNRRFDEARRQVEIGMARYKIDRDELLRTLPTELRAYVEGQITIGASTRRLDYLSPRRGIEIKRVSSNKFMAWHSASPALLNLAVARGIADHGLRPPREYTLILVNEGMAPLGNASMQRLMFDAGVLGISVYQVGSYAQAGELIAQLETEGDDDASDIDLDIEPPSDRDAPTE